MYTKLSLSEPTQSRVRTNRVARSQPLYIHHRPRVSLTHSILCNELYFSPTYTHTYIHLKHGSVQIPILHHLKHKKSHHYHSHSPATAAWHTVLLHAILLPISIHTHMKRDIPSQARTTLSDQSVLITPAPAQSDYYLGRTPYEKHQQSLPDE